MRKVLICVALIVAAVALVPFFGSSYPSAVLASSGSSSPNAVATVIETNSGQIIYMTRISTTSVASVSSINAFKQVLLSDYGLPLAGKIDKDETIKIGDKDTKFRYLVTYDIETKTTGVALATSHTITLTLSFGNYLSFAHYNNLALVGADPWKRPRNTNENTVFFDGRSIAINESTFFSDRTITLANPFNRLFTGVRSANAVNAFADAFNALGGEIDEYNYIFHSSFRRTNVVDADTRRDGLNHMYLFADISDEIGNIVIKDRFANTPIWYAIGVGIALVSMVLIYVTAKGRSKANKTGSVEIELPR
jgi:hypothetical protein